MPLISIVFGIALSTFFGAAFHFWRGGNTQRLIIYIGLSWLGFWGGQYTAQAMDWTFGQVGALYLGMATIGSALALFAGYAFFYLSELREQ